MIDTRNRIEVMLNSIATATPIEDPRDRLEVFISAVADALANSGNTNDIEPRDRIEVLLDAIADAIGNAGLIVAESLSVTENGTYTAPSGKAYTPVTVNVPLPENGYLLKAATAGDTVSFTDGVVAPLNSLKVNVTAVQAGSGTPSSENVRAISGWTKADISNYGGKNIISMQKAANLFGLNYNASAGTITGSNTPTVTSKSKVFKPNTRYTMSFDYMGSSTNNSVFGFLYDDGTQSFGNINKTERTPFSYTSAANKNVVGVIKSFGSATQVTLWNVQIEEGTTATEYEAFVGSDISVAFGTTIYGGNLDVGTGVLTVTDGYIASYDGETLPSTWISSMDEYAPDTTPTTGAKVVYTLETPTTMQLTPTQVMSLQSNNNIYAECGAITECKYYSK